MKAMILAAGKGERLKPLTDTTPKPLLMAGSKALIEYSLEALAKAGVDEVVINISQEPHQFMDKLGDGSRYGLTIQYSYEEGGPYGTAAGIQHALPLLGDDPFILVSGDIWTQFDFSTLPKTLSGAAHLVLMPNPAYHASGDFGLSESGLVTSGTPKLTYASIAVLHPRLFKSSHLETRTLSPLLEEAIAASEVSGERYDGDLINVGTKKELDRVRERLN